MDIDIESVKNGQRSLGNMPAIAEIHGMYYHIYWSRIIYGSSESLLTINTKHTVYEIEYAYKKELTINVGEDVKHLSEGEFIIIPPNTQHQIINSKLDGIKVILGFGSGEQKNTLFSGYNPNEIFDVIKDTLLIRSLIEILDDISRNNKTGSDMLNSLLYSVMFAFIDAAIPDSNQYRNEKKYTENEIRIKQFIEYVRYMNGVDVSVSEAAEKLNVSERHLCRICTTVLQKSPSEIINEYRLKYMKYCIQNTPLSLNEIAGMCGFQTEYAMVKFFRRYENITPSVFRKRK